MGHHIRALLFPAALRTTSYRQLHRLDPSVEHVCVPSDPQVLNLAHNDIRAVPVDIGWLPLTALELEGNANLRIPQNVQAQGFR